MPTPTTPDTMAAIRIAALHAAVKTLCREVHALGGLRAMGEKGDPIIAADLADVPAAERDHATLVARTLYYEMLGS